MASMWEKAKASGIKETKPNFPSTDAKIWSALTHNGSNTASNAAAATQRTARRTKLKAEIMALNRDVNKAKAEFGVLAYEMVVGGDLAGAQKVAFDKKVKIDQWKNAITAKRAEIQRLNEEATAAGEKVPPPTKSEFGDDDDPNGEVVI